MSSSEHVQDSTGDARDRRKEREERRFKRTTSKKTPRQDREGSESDTDRRSGRANSTRRRRDLGLSFRFDEEERAPEDEIDYLSFGLNQSEDVIVSSRVHYRGEVTEAIGSNAPGVVLHSTLAEHGPGGDASGKKGDAPIVSLSPRLQQTMVSQDRTAFPFDEKPSVPDSQSAQSSLLQLLLPCLAVLGGQGGTNGSASRQGQERHPFFSIDEEGVHRPAHHRGPREAMNSEYVKRRIVRDLTGLVRRFALERGLKDPSVLASDSREARELLKELRSRGHPILEDFVFPNGELREQNNPVSKAIERFVDESDAPHDTVMRPPTLGVGQSMVDTMRRVEDGSQVELLVRIGAVALWDHPLLSEEERLASQFKRGYTLYCSELERDRGNYLFSRLEALTSELGKLAESVSSDDRPDIGIMREMAFRNSKRRESSSGGGIGVVPDSMQGVQPSVSPTEVLAQLWEDTLETLSSLIDVEQVGRRSTQHLYGLWKGVQRARARAKATATGLGVKLAKLVDDDGSQPTKRRAAGLLDRLDGVLTQVHGEALAELAREEAKLEAREAKHRREIHEGDSIRIKYRSEIDRQSATVVKVHADGSADVKYASGEVEKRLTSRLIRPRDDDDDQSDDADQGPPVSPEKLQKLKKRMSKLSSSGTTLLKLARSLLSGSSGFGNMRYPFMLKMSSNEPRTVLEDCPRAEQRRRRLVEQVLLYGVLEVNGREVARVPSSGSARLDVPSMLCQFNQVVSLQVVHRPNRVELKLYEAGRFFGGTHLATIPVLLPGSGMHVHGLSPGALSHNTCWYEFASAQASAPPWVVQQAAGSSLDDGASNEGDTAEAAARTDVESQLLRRVKPEAKLRRVQGSVHVSSQWKSSNEASEATGLPEPLLGLDSSRLQGKDALEKKPWEKSNHPRCAKDVPMFAKESDFLGLLPRLDFLDPYDPRNGMLLRLQSQIAAGEIERGEEKGYFRAGADLEARAAFWGTSDHATILSSLMDLKKKREGPTKLTPTWHLLSNNHVFREPARHSLLRLRHENPDSTQFVHPIPISDAIVERTDMYDEVLLRADENLDPITSAKRGDPNKDPLEDFNLADRASQVDVFVRKVRETRLASKVRRRKRQPDPLHTVVRENTILPNFKLMLDLDALMPKPQRRLRPRFSAIPKLIKKHVDPTQIVVQIIEAVNIPLRGVPETDKRGRGRDRDNPELTLKRKDTVDVDGLYGFVEDLDMDIHLEKSRAHTRVGVRFKGKECFTAPGHGRNPQWKQTINVPLHTNYTPGGGSTATTSSAALYDGESLEIALYDEVELRVEDRRSGQKHRFGDQRFLGSFQLPYSTLRSAGRVEGFFRLDVPTVNLGYTYRHGKQQQDSVAMVRATRDVNTDREAEAERGTCAVPPMDDLSPSGLLQRSESETFVKLVVTLDPPFPAPSPIPDIQLSDEYPKLIHYAHEWVESLTNRADLPDGRVFMALAPNLEGEFVFIPRFLHPKGQPPPLKRHVEAAHDPNDDETVANVPQCLRFVSLVPFLSDYTVFRDVDMWCTSAQFMEILAGDDEEHAILLWHYFRWLALHDEFRVLEALLDDEEEEEEDNQRRRRSAKTRKANRRKWADQKQVEFYLVLCRAVPEGETVYVMSFDRSSNEAVLWNASSGQAFSAHDTRCPVLDIGCLVTPDNIYANIQKSGKPSIMARTPDSFNVQDGSKWKPFFTPRMRQEEYLTPGTVQDSMLRYTQPIPVTECELLSQTIEERLRETIATWRQHEKTLKYRGARAYPIFAPDASTRAKDLLKQMEKYRTGENCQLDTAYSLNAMSRMREVNGATLNCTFTDVKTIEEKVKLSGYHKCPHPDVQFVLAVHVVAYPSGVLSIWVFFGTLLPNRS